MVLVVIVARHHWNQSIHHYPLWAVRIGMSTSPIGTDWIVPPVVSDTICSMVVVIDWNRGVECRICRWDPTHRIRSSPPPLLRQPICTMAYCLKIPIMMILLWSNCQRCKCRRRSVMMIINSVVPYHPKYPSRRIVTD